MTKPANEAAKADALLAATAANIEALSNHETARAALMTVAEGYGRDAVAGDMSQTKLAFLFNQAVRDKVATPGDAKEVYLAYARGYNAARADKGSVEIDGVSHSTVGDKAEETGKAAETVAASIFGTFGKYGVVGQGLGLYQRVRDLREKITPENRLHSGLFNAFVAVNRAVIKLADDSTFTDDELRAGKMPAIDDDTILGAIEKKENAGKTMEQKLARLIADAQKLNKPGYFAGLDKVLEMLGKVEKAQTANAPTTVVKMKAA
jgi:hypothetical protein